MSNENKIIERLNKITKDLKQFRKKCSVCWHNFGGDLLKEQEGILFTLKSLGYVLKMNEDGEWVKMEKVA